MTQRSIQAFTLIELMIVVAIIGILAALIMPATSYALRQANIIRCSNNLSQISKGMLSYAIENSEAFPPTMLTLVNTGGYGMKSLICPLDKNNGRNTEYGRDPAWNRDSGVIVDYKGIIESNAGASYFYEGSSDPAYLHPKTLNYFFRDREKPSEVVDEMKTWQRGKYNQQQNGRGNLNATGTNSYEQFSLSFPSSGVPFVRCYHHFPWKDGAATQYTKREVNNVALAGNVFTSIPFWELQYSDHLAVLRRLGEGGLPSSNIVIPPP